MSLSEILEEIPKLPFAERQEIARRAISVDPMLTADEELILDPRMRDFEEHPESGISLGDLVPYVQARLQRA